MPGTRIGPYEILAAIGAGGMGEVYRACDTKLNRDVAIKILPDLFSSDVQRLARFTREAQTLASLNHPNIAHIHGLEEAGGVRALVMELVEGEDLAERIAHGAMPLDEALPIAKQIVEALEAAHEQGVIHRDLKPANIKVRTDGTVKVLDFGLAKAVGSAPDVSLSPTITSPVVTSAGVILGTAAYMAPEQAKGKPVDRRADIWAFGCVLFEMLTGSRAFGGEDGSDTIAAILRAEPDWTLLDADVSPSVRRLLRRSLQKEVKRRLQHIGDARLELDDHTVPDVDAGAPAGRRPTLWMSAAAAMVAALIGGAAGWSLTNRGASRAEIVRFSLPVPSSFANTTIRMARPLAISPDGRMIVYAVAGVGLTGRRLDESAFAPIRGAEIRDAAAPFFSPDGESIGYFSEDKLLKLPRSGGLSTTLMVGLEPAAEGTWGDDGTIVVARQGDLYEVPSAGGAQRLLLKGNPEARFSRPYLLPGSEALLTEVGTDSGGERHIEIVSRKTKTRRAIGSGGNPQLSAQRMLVFEQQGQIWAAPFDMAEYVLTGTPRAVVTSVRIVGTAAMFAVSTSGALAYMIGDSGLERSMVWIDRTGKTVPAIDARDGFQSPRLSPDGRHVAVSISKGADLDIWTFDLERGSRVRLTGGGANRRNVWSPDGKQIAYYSRDDSSADSERDIDIYVTGSTGENQRRLLARPGPQFPDTWSPSGKYLVFSDGEGGLGGRRDMWLLPLGQAAIPLLVTRFNERGAMFSPDGQWLAFVTDETGRSEVYVQSFPASGAKIPVSVSGGLQPIWSRDGRELYYREGDWLMSVPVSGPTFTPGVPTRMLMLAAGTYNLDQNFADYDVAADGRVLAIRGDAPTNDEIQVVLNWGDEIRRLSGSGVG
jgi:eukaryotic-like serine/threonine-protein kinase